MRGQAELISLTIIVSLAVILALGFIYLFTPIIKLSSGQKSLASLIARAVNDIVVYEAAETDNGLVSAIVVSNSGSRAYRVYLTALSIGPRGLPEGKLNYTVYILEGSIANLSGSEGWARLRAEINVSSGRIYVFTGSEFLPLSSLGWASEETVKLVDLGVLPSGHTSYFKVVVGQQPGMLNICLYLFVRVGNNFYEVGALRISG